jgi:predicted AlkP superfamily phosphohydrolase/phosphomutase
LFDNVDWSRTTAYALGLNGVFVNLRGRERGGIVAPGEEYEQLLDRLERDLRALTDPRTGLAPVSTVTRPAAAFHGPYAAAGPDLLVGYRRGYRSSWESPLGAFPASVFADNDRAWSGDHCIDPRLVPGVLLANRQILVDRPGLADLTVAILDEWGIPPLPEMTGRDCLGGPLSDPDPTPAADP